MIVGEAKKRILSRLGDSYYGITFEDSIRLLGVNGFEECFREEFVRVKTEVHGDQTELLMAFINKRYGLFLVCDSYRGDLNSGHVHYCWKPGFDIKARVGFSFLGSGGYQSISEPDWRRTRSTDQGLPTDLYWKGDKDVREGLNNHIATLMREGDFICPWPKHPSSYFDIGLSCGNDYEVIKEQIRAETGAEPVGYQEKYRRVDELRKARYDRLPEDVKAILNVEFNEVQRD